MSEMCESCSHSKTFLSALALHNNSSGWKHVSGTRLLICYFCFLTDGPTFGFKFAVSSFNVFLTENQLPFRLQRHMYGEAETPVGGLWEQSSGSKLLPHVPADVPAGMGSDGPSKRLGKVRVTRWVKLDPSGQLARVVGLCSPAGIISIRTHAGWRWDYNRVYRVGNTRGHTDAAGGQTAKIWQASIIINTKKALSPQKLDPILINNKNKIACENVCFIMIFLKIKTVWLIKIGKSYIIWMWNYFNV